MGHSSNVPGGSEAFSGSIGGEAECFGRTGDTYTKGNVLPLGSVAWFGFHIFTYRAGFNNRLIFQANPRGSVRGSTMALRLAVVWGIVLVPLEITAQAEQKVAERRPDSTYYDRPKSSWLSLKVITLNSETQIHLAKELALGGRPNPSGSWDKIYGSRSSRTRPALMKGYGYVGRIHLRVPGKSRTAKLSGYARFAFARGNVRYLLGPIRWLALRDDKGNDLLPLWKEAKTSSCPIEIWDEDISEQDPRWWTVLTPATGATLYPECREIGINFQMYLGDLSADKMSVMRGYVYALFATKWESLRIKDPAKPQAQSKLPESGRRVTWLGIETRQKKTGCFFQVEGLADLPGVPKVRWLANEPVILNVGQPGRRGTLRCSLWSWPTKDTLYFIRDVRSKAPFDKALEVRIMTEAAAVRIPFEFRGVSVPGERIGD